MDDWGSPWADEVQIEHSVQRPATPVQASDLDFEGKRHTGSPWDDGEDESFGEWGSIPVADAGFDGAGDGWAIDSMEGRAVGDKVGINRTTSIREGNNRNISLALSSVHAELVRKTSDNNWVDGVVTVTNSSTLANSTDTENELQSPISIPAAASTPRPVIFDDILEEPAYVPKSSSELLHFRGSEQDPEVEHTLSRPSSSPSEHSQHDELPQESPRTSIDDEPKRSQISRKASSIMPGPVGTLNHLAKPENNQLLDSRSVVSRAENDDAKGSGEEIEDYGDFEEGQSDIESLRSDLPTDGTTQPLPKEHESVGFKIDSSMFDKIYANLSKDTSKEDLFIPDTVPFDSFSSTEQRKLWYRISRYGPMRKHNNGDDENYARVNWVHSKVREETLKIVGRWMEEDRISGRIVLGGSHSSIFGWNDPKSSPIPLSQALSERRPKRYIEEQTGGVNVPTELPIGLVRDQSTSNPKSPSKASRNPSLESIPAKKESMVSTKPPVAAFGWNSGLEGSHTSIDRLPGRSSPLSSSKSVMASKHPTIPPNTNGGNINIPIAPPITTRQETNLSQPTLSPNAISDDDWGEMVSSPLTVAPPAFPSTHGLSHKKSQSLGGAFILPLQTFPAQPMILPPNRSSISIIRSADKSITQSGIHRGLDTTASPTISIESFGKSLAAQVKGVLGTESTSVVVTNADPWASADFSFFEKGIKTGAEATISSMPSNSVPVENADSHVPFPEDQRSREETEQDRIVQSVVKTLPDLSYMLRK